MTRTYYPRASNNLLFACWKFRPETCTYTQQYVTGFAPWIQSTNPMWSPRCPCRTDVNYDLDCCSQWLQDMGRTKCVTHPAEVAGALLLLLSLSLSLEWSQFAATAVATTFTAEWSARWHPQRFIPEDENHGDRLLDNEIVDEYAKPLPPIQHTVEFLDFAASLYSWVFYFSCFILIYLRASHTLDNLANFTSVSACQPVSVFSASHGFSHSVIANVTKNKIFVYCLLLV